MQISGPQYINCAQSAMKNILYCFSGNLSHRRSHSVVCIAHLNSFKMSHLPYGKYIKLASKDIQCTCTQKIINMYYGYAQLRDMSKLYTTNMCENMHSRLFSYAPKNTVLRRNFPRLYHSVTLGASESLLHIARYIGLPVHATDLLYKYAMKLKV